MLAPGEQSQFNLTFNPLVEGTFWCTLKVFSDDPDHAVYSVSIEGEGMGFGMTDGTEPVVVDKTMSNAPNPFNPSTTISFYAPQDGNAAVRIYNLRGQLVRQLDAGMMSVGRGSVEWGGRDRRGSSVASGVYFYQLHINGRKVGETGRAMLLK